MSFLCNPYRYAGAATDPNFSSTKLLLSGDGSAGSSTFTDESASARGNASLVGSPVVSTTAKFGSGSIRLPGAGAVTFGDSADWAFASDDFTMETWARFDAAKIGVSEQAIIAQWTGIASGSGAWGWYLTTTALSFKASSSGSAPAGSPFPISYTWTPTADTFYHLVVERSGSTWRMYIDGSMVAKITSSLSIVDIAGSLMVGSHRSGSFSNLQGYVDEVRITRGVARYASDSGYAVPTAAFPRS